jgi:hypothetical protein
LTSDDASSNEARPAAVIGWILAVTALVLILLA